MRSPLLFALTALALVLLAMETAWPRFFLHDDNASWFAGAYLHDFRVLTETGRLAEVNWFQHGGEPFLQQGQTAVLYPPVYLGVALAKVVSGDVIWTIDWVAAIHLALALVGFYLWMQQGGVEPRIAALGGLAWALNPFVLFLGAGWIFTTIVAALLPWIFWAFDRLVTAPSARHALCLGGSVGLLFLQGYVQWFAYTILLFALYALFFFCTRAAARRPAALLHFFIAMLIAAALILPLLLPMIHATTASALRANPIPIDTALVYSVIPHDLLVAQFCFFDFNLIISLSVVALYCPPLLLLPLSFFRLFCAKADTRLTLIALILIGLVALVLSTDAHQALSRLPLFNKFRWPFKVFLLADFFFFAALVRSMASWADANFPSARAANRTAILCLVVVIAADLSISLTFHDRNLISRTTLPASSSPLPSGMNLHLGRAVTFSDDLPDAEAYRYASHAYATWYGFPSLGGYDPLVDLRQIEFSYYLDYPNFCTGTITPDFRACFQGRAVRYWIVDARSSQLDTIKALPDMKLIDQDETRFVFEDFDAAPMAFDTAMPTIACPVNYSGNSMLIPVSDIKGTLKVSAGPTDGWWFRADGGPWRRPDYQSGWLTLTPGSSARLVEITYFDPRFREGLLASMLLLIVAAFLVVLSKKLGNQSPRRAT